MKVRTFQRDGKSPVIGFFDVSATALKPTLPNFVQAASALMVGLTSCQALQERIGGLSSTPRTHWTPSL